MCDWYYINVVVLVFVLDEFDEVLFVELEKLCFYVEYVVGFCDCMDIVIVFVGLGWLCFCGGWCCGE